MKARIGVADSAKVIELEVDDAAAFRGEVEAAVSSDEAMTWFTDSKDRMVGVPSRRIAYVEVETEESARVAGFHPGE